jgi:cell division protein FtsN
MAARKRSSATRRSKQSNAAPLLIGAFAVGLAVAAAAYWWGTRSAPAHAPKRTTAPVTTPSPAPAPPRAVTPTKSGAPAKAPKPHFDFYTLLPGETVLPDSRPPRDGAKTAKRPTPGKTAKVEPESSTFVLQAASYASFDEADRLKAKLVLSGLEARIEKVTIENKGDFYRVRLGPYASIDELDATDKRLTELGIRALRLRVKKAAGA